MREGLLPPTVSRVMRLSTTEKTARATTEALGELLDPTETAVAAFEQTDGVWLLEAYFAHEPDEDAIRALVAAAVGPEAAAAARFEPFTDIDWVKASFEGLKPVPAGRFVIHGSHDRGVHAPQKIAIEIEAALAFGTGHHGTTRGCLLALDDHLKRHRPRAILDVGTGTGVLAIAAARALKRKVLASDIDKEAVVAAQANARANKAGGEVTVIHAAGLEAGAFVDAGRFDLVLANILARPLMRLARPMRRLLAPGATVILSGLLPGDVNRVASAYRDQGLHLARATYNDGWATLVLTR